MIITKNIQTEETINKMAAAAFPEKKVSEIKELTEGMCNVAYSLTFEDGSECILKIAAVDRSGNTSNEVNLMNAEVKAMKLVKSRTDIKVAEVLYYDTSKTICSGDYFFMEKLDGDNLALIREGLDEGAIDVIYEEVGELSRKLTGITNRNAEGKENGCESGFTDIPGFGFLGEKRRFERLYDFTKVMLTNLLGDAHAKNVDILYSDDCFLNALLQDEAAFDEVKVPTLVHWDLWEGNVFVKDNHVTGIIDWERAMWGEAFMDDRFREHSRNEHFLRGFGKTEFTENELKRIRWYDIILYLTMMIEVFYRGFEDDGQYKWAGEMLRKVMERKE